MKDSLKLLIIQTSCFLLLIFFTAGVIGYADGNFELPFISRPQNTAGPDSGENNPGDTVIELIEEPIDNINTHINPDNFLPQSENSSLGRTTVFPSYKDLAKEGFYPSEEIYEKYDEQKTELLRIQYSAERKALYDKAVAEATDPSGVIIPEMDLPPIYEYRFAKIELDTQRLTSEYTSAYNGEHRINIQPKMGIVIVNDSAGSDMLHADGKAFLKDYKDISFMGIRDGSNRLLFGINEAYYYWDDADGGFQLSDYNPEVSSRGVPFLYPSYYGLAGNSGITRFISNSKWGYKNIDTDKNIVSATYDFVYNFSEEIGIAVKNDAVYGKKLYFINTSGNIVNSSFYMPDTLIGEHIGFCYFDNGLTRVLKRSFRWDGKMISESDILVDSSGKEFILPPDYTLKAYSNGIALLEKNGVYGYMNYLGYWIAQPIYTYARPFNEGVAVIGFEDGKKALIDTQGNLITQFAYDEISDCSGGVVALFEKEQGWTVLNKVRREVTFELYGVEDNILS